MNIRKDIGLTFDDVLIAPQHSSVRSRLDVDTSFSIGELNFSVPIISSPMDTVTEWGMALEMSRLGGLGIIHRFMDISHQVLNVRKVKDLGEKVGAAVGIKEVEFDRLESLLKAGVDLVCIDVAHATNHLVLEFAKEIRSISVPIMIGNIASGHELDFIFSALIPDAVRIGIGSGSICTTRIVTGHGVPQLTAIDDVSRKLKYYVIEHGEEYEKTKLIADGGIRTSGDIVKAFAAGANAVMAGNLLAGCKESPGEEIKRNGMSFKKIRGMSSQGILQETKPNPYDYVAEGVEGYVPYAGTVEEVINSLVAGIRSGLSYSGSHNIQHLQEFAEFIRITPAGWVESNSHGVLK